MQKQIAKDTMKLRYLDILPHKNVADYYSSRNHLSSLHVRTYEWDSPRPDPEVFLTCARRTLARTEQDLVDKRIVFKKTRLDLEKQWQQLREKELELKNTFEKMSHFITTNDAKRIRARERLVEDTKTCKKRAEEIEKLKVKIAFMSEVKKEMDFEIAKHRLYDKYLNLVVTRSDEFKNPDDLIDRYESLVRTKNELGERQSTNLKLLEMSKSTMSKLIEEYSFIILGLNNSVADLHGRYRKVKINAMRWESLVWAIKAKAFKKHQEINEVKQACRNIYNMMSKRKGETAKIAPEDLENQLNYIKKTLRELQLVREEAINQTKKTISSVKGQASKAS